MVTCRCKGNVSTHALGTNATENYFWAECDSCGAETDAYPSKKLALKAFKQGKHSYDIREE